MNKDLLHSEYQDTNTKLLNLLKMHAVKDYLNNLMKITRINLKTEGRMKTMDFVVLDHRLMMCRCQTTAKGKQA
jgi:hypothetical protein